MFLKHAREHLERLRADPATWGDLAYVEYRDEDDEQFDRNAAARGAVLLALQYDRRAEDAGLLRYILEQEVLYHEDSDLQGLMETLPLACYLVGLLGVVEDVGLLARAKAANFDTECGLSRELLFAAGVDATIAYVRASGGADATLAALVDEGVPLCEQAEVDGYWRAMASYWPASPEEEHPLTLASHAEELEETEVGVAALERWLVDAARIADEAERTVAIDARWAGQIVEGLRGQTEDAGLRGRLDVVAAAIAAMRA